MVMSMKAKSFSPTSNSVLKTNHACQRMAQRNLSNQDLDFILMVGRRFHRAGVVLIHLCRKDIPARFLRHNQFARLEGTTLVLGRDAPILITVWRNRRGGLRHIQHKFRNVS